MRIEEIFLYIRKSSNYWNGKETLRFTEDERLSKKKKGDLSVEEEKYPPPKKAQNTPMRHGGELRAYSMRMLKKSHLQTK